MKTLPMNQKPKILLAEDDEFLSKALKYRLEERDYFVIHAKDGDEALSKIKEEQPDIILLDIAMPGKNGFDVLKEIKKSKETKKIPTIIISNLGQESDIEEGFKLGASDYLVKSDFSTKEIVEKVEKYLKN